MSYGDWVYARLTAGERGLERGLLSQRDLQSTGTKRFRCCDALKLKTRNAMDDAPKEQKSKRTAKADPDRLVYSADELLQGRREAWIEHAGEFYRLRVTAAGKLYLTK